MGTHICTDESWHECLKVLDSNKAITLLDRKALQDVLICARDSDQRWPDAMVYKVRAGSKRQAVDTDHFKNFIHEHAAICHAKERAAKKAKP